jgi:hypothetical protein
MNLKERSLAIQNIILDVVLRNVYGDICSISQRVLRITAKRLYWKQYAVGVTDQQIMQQLNKFVSAGIAKKTMGKEKSTYLEFDASPVQLVRIKNIIRDQNFKAVRVIEYCDLELKTVNDCRSGELKAYIDRSCIIKVDGKGLGNIWWSGYSEIYFVNIWNSKHYRYKTWKSLHNSLKNGKIRLNA